MEISTVVNSSRFKCPSETGLGVGVTGVETKDRDTWTRGTG